MKGPSTPTITLLTALTLSGCRYSVETLPACYAANVPSSLRAIAQLAQAKAYNGEEIEIEHTLCSTHYDRLANAERLITAAGFRHSVRGAELGKCIGAQVKSALTPTALERQVTVFCRIAADSRVAYVSWSGMVDQKFVYVSGKYFSISRPGEQPKLVKVD
jgi:hypothetical protein